MNGLEDNGNAVVVREHRPTAISQPDSSGISPLQLIQFAIENKTPASELKELVALAEHVEERTARKAFFDALRRFQQACPPVKKSKTAKIATKGGGSYSYSYAELDVIESTVKPHLDAEDLSYSFDTIVDEKGVMLTNICTLRHGLGHTEQSRFTLPTASESAMSAQQRFAAANNFAKRQTLAAVLGISITDKEIPDEEVDPATITEDQATFLSDLQQEVGASRERFLAWLGVDSFFDIRAADYDRALAALNQKKRGSAS